MKRLTKTIVSSLISTPSRVSLLALAVAFGISGNARAGDEMQVCGPQTLRGSYTFDAHGFNIVSGVAVPKAILEGIDFNGDGTLVSPFVTLSINGIIIHGGGTTGTYTVAEDCTGTVTFADGASFDTYARANGNQLWMMQTAGPGGVAVVFEGMAIRVAR